MEHFGSEAGVSDAMVYMTVIETLKMWGYNVKEYLERIFADAVKGITDYTQYDHAVMSPRDKIIKKITENRKKFNRQDSDNQQYRSD